MTAEKKNEKTAVQKMRERYYEIKKNIKPPKELYDILKKKDQTPSKEERESDKKIAKNPEAGI